MVKVLLALLPSAGVLFIFWLGIKALVEADRRERKAQAQWDAEARRGAPPGDHSSGGSSGPDS